jgi:hypothetical protein
MTIYIPPRVVLGLAGALGLATAALLAHQWGDMKRYMKIERM